MLGKRIRALRRECGMTVHELAEATSLSPSAISQVERGVIDPSLRTLRSIAAALGVPIFSFFIDAPLPGVLVRSDQRRSFSPPERNAVFELLTPDLNRRLEVAMMRLEPGTSSSDEPLPHAGDECLVVLEGTAEIEMGGSQYILNEGDSIYIDEGIPHKVTNAGEGSLVCLAAMAPASF